MLKEKDDRSTPLYLSQPNYVSDMSNVYVQITLVSCNINKVKKLRVNAPQEVNIPVCTYPLFYILCHLDIYIQRKVISLTKALREEAISRLYCSTLPGGEALPRTEASVSRIPGLHE